MHLLFHFSAEDRLFIYKSSNLQGNVDDKSLKIKVPFGLPIGTNVYKTIYVSIFLLLYISKYLDINVDTCL